MTRRAIALAVLVQALLACGGEGGTPPAEGAAEPNDTLATATPITLGGSIPASIDPAADLDFYSFTVASDALDVRFRTFDASGGACLDIDPRIDVYGADGTLLAWADDGAGLGYCEDLTLTLGAGTYYVEVRWAGNGTAPFDYVLTTSAASAGAATPQTLRCLWAGDVCDEIAGTMTPSQRSVIASSCATGGGSFAEGTCSQAGTVAGHCRYDDTILAGVSVAGGTIDEYYDGAAWTLTDAQAFCAVPPAGTWVP